MVYGGRSYFQVVEICANADGQLVGRVAFVLLNAGKHAKLLVGPRRRSETARSVGWMWCMVHPHGKEWEGGEENRGETVDTCSHDRHLFVGGSGEGAEITEQAWDKS